MVIGVMGATSQDRNPYCRRMIGLRGRARALIAAVAATAAVGSVVMAPAVVAASPEASGVAVSKSVAGLQSAADSPADASSTAASSASPRSLRLGRGVTPQVVGGVPANRAQTPWYVLINPQIGGNYFLCGGTAISPYWILTAAHCVTNSAGGPMTSSEIADSASVVNPVSLSQPGVVYGWSEVVVHPDWNADQLTNDIALIRTSSAMATTPATYTSDTSGPTAGTALQVFGFGATSYGGPVSQILQVGNILDLTGVTGSCGGYGQWYHSATQVCAGLNSGTVDACQGDSGGPLTAPAGSGRTVVGVVSFGYQCGHPDFPGVYTRVARYSPWIAAVSGIPANAVQTGVRSPGRAVISRSCSTKVCKLSKGGKPIKISVRNAGGEAISWSVSASKLKRSPAFGNLSSGGTATSKLSVSNKTKACVAVKVMSSTGTTTKFKVATNGKKC